MPSAIAHDDDDPVVASYDVYITKQLPKSDESSSESKSDSRLFVLQYPAHRSASKPYNAAAQQKPTRLRIKPNTGMIEVEVPMLTQKNFNLMAGQKYGKSLAESRLAQLGGSHGLAGGFTSGPVSAQNINLNDIPLHREQRDKILDTQTLGGKIVDSCARDPVYMLGSFQNSELHLTHLDAVVQMRPQLHHIDAEEEVNQKRIQASTTPASKMKVGFEAPPTKLESKAIELKMKDNKEDPKDRNLNQNATLLRAIQVDEWKSHDWVDEGDQLSWSRAEAFTTLRISEDSSERSRQLQSMLTNDDWLGRMSVPREDGKKGLRAKLKGRDRERARRKKVEHQRRQINADNPSNVPRADVSSDSDVSSLSEHSDVEMVDGNTGLGEVDIKEEPGNLATAPAIVPSIPDAVPVAATQKRRGRPRKNG